MNLLRQSQRPEPDRVLRRWECMVVVRSPSSSPASDTTWSSSPNEWKRHCAGKAAVWEYLRRVPSVRELVDAIRRRDLPNTGDGDPFVEAWRRSDDVEAMIDLLREGAAIGLYRIDSVQTWDGPGGPTRWLVPMKTPEGRWVRVDVTREGGAEAVRAALPEIARHDQWAGAFDAERSTRDPIEVLVADLKRLGRADPRWAAEHSLTRVWRTTTKSLAMRELLEVLGRHDLRERAQEAIGRIPRPPRPSRGDALARDLMQRRLDRWDATLADAIRAVVPEPPPLPGERGESNADIEVRPSGLPRGRWTAIVIAIAVVVAALLLRFFW